MDIVSGLTSILAIIQTGATVGKICGGYILQVKNARDEIIRLQRRVLSLVEAFKALEALLRGPSASSLSCSQALGDSIADCHATLTKLEKDLSPRKRDSAMKRIGAHAMIWPFKKEDVEGKMRALEGFQGTIHTFLNIENRMTLTDMNQTTDRISHYMDLQQLPVAQGAEFDSYTDQHEEKCLPGTRTDLLRQVREWATSPNGESIFWLSGRAGTGKSTISRTVADTLKKADLLGASFFFKRGEGDRGNAMKLFPTITSQLVKSIPQMFTGVQEVIRGDPTVATKGLEEQFNRLILQPLLGIPLSTASTSVVVIVIDALDECEGDQNIQVILRLLPKLQKLNGIQLRVFLTSRPELPIRMELRKLAHNDHKDMILHEIPMEIIRDDLSLYLKHRIAEIKNEREPPLPIDWPGPENLQKLVALSVPLFIFAATICRIFQDPDWDPLDSLPEILEYEREESKLASTYLPVLDRLLKRQTGQEQKEKLVQHFHQVVGVIVTLESPLSVISLSKLIGVSERLIITRLNPLHSILSVPQNEALPVQLFHVSFRDFLLDEKTRGKTPFWVDKEKMHYTLATKCLLVCDRLSKNICRLPRDGTQRAEINLDTIGECLPAELQYACCYWVYHLNKSKDRHTMMPKALLFLQEHFLHWMEAMSILGRLSDFLEAIKLLQTVAQDEGSSALSEFVSDANRFVLRNSQIADDAPLQLYCSGLIFAPTKSIVRTQFQADLPTWMCRFPRVEENWSTERQILEGHSDFVNSVAFSPNKDELLASGSSDNTIRFWNPTTGALRQTLEAHTGPVHAVAFSPNDGRLLASGSEDDTVRIWDTATGSLQQTLKGHSGPVQSVAFSPNNGRLLASGSDDNTVRLWDTATGTLQNVLDGNSGSINSISFSPQDERLIASCSGDNLVRLWDKVTGSLKQTLEGHAGTVNSVAFSPDDGRLLASGSFDKTVRLWDTATGGLQKVIGGDSGAVHSLAFSPNGMLLVAGTADNTLLLLDLLRGGTRQQTLKAYPGLTLSVAFSPSSQLLVSASRNTLQLWDVSRRAIQQTPEGHARCIRSMAFSPDGRLLASSSYGKTIRLWDTQTGALKQTLRGHLASARSVAFSPNGQLLVSNSNDNTVRVWDVSRGALQHTLAGHLSIVWSVTFSPDGRILASGSYDKTVRLWDIETGALLQTFEGHTGLVSSVAFSPNGQLLASTSTDKTIRLWDMATYTLEHTLKDHLKWARSIVFSPNGRLLASCSDDKTVRLWDTPTGALQQTLEGHSQRVASVAFSPDSQLLASSSYDDTVRLWNTATGALLQTFNVGGPATNLQFSSDCSHLSTNMGYLDIRKRLGHLAPDSPSLQNMKMFMLDGQWIVINGAKLLRLPLHVRSSRSATKGNTIALGFTSGQICLMEFQVL